MDTSQILAITTVTLSFLSVCACIYVVVTSYDKIGLNCSCPCLAIPNQTNTATVRSPSVDLTDSASLPMQNIINMGSFPETKTIPTLRSSPPSQNFLIDIIFCMVVTDGLHSISIFINWFPSLSPSIPFYSPTLCMTFGIIAEFFVIQSPCWHVLLALHLFCLLCGCCFSTKLTSNKKYHIAIICIFIPALVVIIPCIIDGGIKNAYGSFDNLSNSDEECWVKSKSFQVVYVVFILGSLMIHYIVVLVALYKYWHVYSGLRLRYWNIVLTLVRFVIVFSIIRFFPALERIMELIYDDPPPDWLIMCHHIGIASLGIGDGCVWYLNIRQHKKNDEWEFETTEKQVTKKGNDGGDIMDRLNQNVFETPDQIYDKIMDSPQLSYQDETVDNVKKNPMIIFRGRM